MKYIKNCFYSLKFVMSDESSTQDAKRAARYCANIMGGGLLLKCFTVGYYLLFRISYGGETNGLHASQVSYCWTVATYRMIFRATTICRLSCIFAIPHNSSKQLLFSGWIKRNQERDGKKTDCMQVPLSSSWLDDRGKI